MGFFDKPDEKLGQDLEKCNSYNDTFHVSNLIMRLLRERIKGYVAIT